MRLRSAAFLPAIVFVTLAFVVGCRPATIKTAIPKTNLEVHLNGPDPKNHYQYTVIENEVVVARRFLGPAQVTSQIAATVLDDGKGRVTLTWGSGRGAAFTIIDTKNRVIIEDSNQANQPNQPFGPQP